jgi:hypothetical protein
MTGTGRSLGALLGSVIVSAVPAAAQPMRLSPTSPAAMPAPMTAMPAPGQNRVVLSEVVDAAHRDAVLAVVRKPTLSTRGTSEDLVCTPAVYEWLLDHPDRVSLAWQRLKVPCVEITNPGNGRFAWADGEGSELTWQKVGRFADGLVWYATGKVKPSAVTPTVPVRAVVVMAHPRRPRADGTAALAPSAQVFLQTDSRAANLVLRVMGPTAPKLAEQGAEQLLFFFAGIAKYTQTHPEKAEELLAPPRK